MINPVACLTFSRSNPYKQYTAINRVLTLYISLTIIIIFHKMIVP